MIGDGAAAGAILSSALVAVSYLGWRLGALPFAPFDLFDWLTRELPGWVVTFGIDSFVTLLRPVHPGGTATAAKSAEQAIAIAAFVAAGSLVGAVALAVLQRSEEPALVPGAILGGLLGASTVFIEQSLNRIDAGFHTDAAWVLATFAACGIAFGWVVDRWRGLPAPGRAQTPDHSGTPVSSVRPSTDRRRFLLRVAWIAGLPTAATVAWSATARGRVSAGVRWSDAHPLPNAGALVVPVRGTRSEFTALENHYRIDVDTRVPVVDARDWRLRVGGMVRRPLELTLNDVQRREPLNQFVTLACISNPLGGDLIGTTRWTGISLRELLGDAVVDAGATHLKVRSADGFFELVSLATIESDARLMLAYAWDGRPLAMEHGFPLRLYVPNVYGMKLPKWVNTIEVVDHWEPGYWVARGWDRDGVMKTTSVIDAAEGKSVGGIAHAGARGISRVEVRVDDGEWRSAQLREPLSGTTWVIWRAEIQDSTGTHDVAVRCYDGNGMLQAEPFHAKRLALS